MQSWLAIAGALSVLIAATGILNRRRRNPRRLPLPPGPKGLPLVGNAFQALKGSPWEAYDTLCKKYGDIVYLNLLGQDVIILGSSRRAFELLESRATNYSDRPSGIAMIELTKTSWNLTFMSYGQRWRLHRRAFHDQLGKPAAVARYHPIMYEETSVFLRKLKENPDEFASHIQSLFGTTVMRTAYGIDDKEKTAEFIQHAETLIRELGEAKKPGQYLVNSFPILKYIPAWFPGAQFQKHFQNLAQLCKKVHTVPFDVAKARYSAKSTDATHPSMAGAFIERFPGAGADQASLAEAESLARNVCAIAYIAGVDTTTASGTGLFYILASHPGIQKKAQEELDVFIGSGRLPLISDRAQLPYVHALTKELSRWYTVVPLGAVHTSAEDDEYDGYFIPKGTFFIPNTWAMMHDPAVFDRPFEFRPERFLDKDGKVDPRVIDAEYAAFGFGRRVCPGRFFSNDALFLMTSCLLSTFIVEAPKDDAGNPIPLDFKLESNNLAKLHPFKCDITMRPERASLVL
ncbi:cytochrome P450 98A3 [Ephemerocybe angulata]|uniref:Cytochrome P450 98A3 n=1 Tax=Ephemerocybe angulata TaxID=980116 RepID=A0A8H6HU39_9AGAR|nr:cytochrome P450 98A3 [Tulosesus angulatus]